MTTPDVSFRLNMDPGNTGSVIDGVEAGAKRVENAIKRIGNVKPLDAARDILDIRGFGAIRREIQLVEASYKRLADSGKLSAEELAAADRARAASVARLKAEMSGATGHVAELGKVSGQTANAMRMLPAQLSDVATQLAGGQNPFMVLMQQGLQTRDMFGSFGAMFRGLGAVLTPVRLAVGGVGTAVSLLALAAVQGNNESAALNKTIEQTGNFAGVTAGKVADMSERIAASAGVTKLAAREAVTAAVSMGTFGVQAIEAVGEAMAIYAKQTGQDMDQVRGVFSRLGSDPTAWAKEQNQALNFLTASTYAQIKALQEAGKTQEAAALAARSYTEANKGVPDGLGAIERAAKAAAKAASDMWNALMGIGRTETLDERLENARQKVQDLREIAAGGDYRPFALLAQFSARRNLPAAEQGLADAQEMQALERRSAARSAEIAATEKGRIAAIDYRDAMQSSISPMKERAKLLAELDRNVARLAGTENAWTDAEVKRARQEIIQRTTDKSGLSAAQAAADLRLAILQAANAAELRAIEGHATELDSLRKRGLVSERQAIEQEAGLAVDRALIRQKGLQQELQVLQSRPLDSAPGAKAKRDAEVAALVAQIADAAAAAERAWVQGAANIGQLDLSQARESAQQYANAYTALSSQVDQQSEAIASAQAALIVDPIEMARAQAEVSARKIRKTAQEIAREYSNLIAVLRGRGQDSEADALQAKLDQFLADSLKREQQEREKADADIAKNAVEEWKKASEKISDSLTDALMRGFEGGKNAATNLRDAVVNMFKTMVLRPVVQSIVQPLAQGITGAIFGGVGSSIGGSIAGSIGSSMFASGAGSALGNVLTGAGVGIWGGSAAYGAALGTASVGAGSQAAMLAAQTGAFGAEGAAMTAAAAGNAGTAGAMSGLGAAMPWVGGILLAASLLKSMDKSGTPHMGFSSQYSAAAGTSEWTDIGGFNDNAQRKAEMASFTNSVAQGVGQMLDQTAIAFGKSAGYQVATAFADDTSKDGAWGALRIMLAGSKVTDWADTQSSKWAPKVFADGEKGQQQYLSAVASDVRSALEQIGMPEWAKGWLDQLGSTPTIEQMGAVVARINETATALRQLGEAMPMLKALSDDAKIGLINAAGGLQALAEGLNAYETRILSESEQTALKTERLSDAFAALGLSVPKSKAEFQALVKGIDASTVAGQSQLAGVLRLSNAFADLHETTGGLSQSVADLGDSLQSEIDRIRGLITGSGAENAAQAAARFAIATAQARAGDAEALRSLPDLSRTMLDSAAEQATSRAELIRIQAQTLASLEQTQSIVRGGVMASGAAVPTANAQGATQAAADEAATQTEALRQVMDAFRADNNAGMAALAGYLVDLVKLLERVMPEGDALATRDANSNELLRLFKSVINAEGTAIATEEIVP